MMTDLKALRIRMSVELAATFVGNESEEDQVALADAVAAAMLRYSEACLGEPSEGMVERGNFSAASASSHDHTVRGMFNAMASQRLKEIK